MPYNQLQQSLHAKFRDPPILVVEQANDSRCSYLPTAETYGKQINKRLPCSKPAAWRLSRMDALAQFRQSATSCRGEVTTVSLPWTAISFQFLNDEDNLMKKALAIVILVPFTLIFAGCGSSPDSLVEDQIDHMNDLAEAIEDDAPESELEAIGKRMEKTSEKLKELDLSEKEQKRRQGKYEEDVKKASARLMKAMMGKAGREMGKGFPVMPSFGN